MAGVVGVVPVETKQKPFVLTTVDDGIIRTVHEFHYLSADQLLRLSYSKASITYVRSRLKRLADYRFLQRTWAVRATPFGKPPTLYRLGRDGITYLKDAGYMVAMRYRPSEHVVHSDGHLAHVLAVNDVLIAARKLSTLPYVQLQGVKHDLDLKREPVPIVPLLPTPGELQSVVPDAWIDLVVTTPVKRRFPLVVEVDRGTRSVRDFKRKIRSLLAYLSGSYQKTFGTKFVSVVFVVDQAAFTSSTGAQKRVKDILRWTQEEMKVHKKQELAGVFYAGILPRGDALSPTSFFGERVFLQPFQTLPVSLLDLPQHHPGYQNNGVSKPLPATY